MREVRKEVPFEMKVAEAIKILNPETSAQAIAEIERNAEYNREKVMEKVNEACRMGAEALAKQEKLREWMDRMEKGE